ncbi:MAG: hydrogenase iron-sulfur subunit, partial [Polyangia bacterium]|nr:hydrogenase iron-sulfur subunit [Polyangia bacterium]
MSGASSIEGAVPRALVFYCEAGSLADPPEPPALPGVAFLRVPCVCRISEGEILRGLRQGARAVLLLGCHEGACKFHGGDARGEEAVGLVRRLLGVLGLPAEAVALLRLGPSAGALPEVRRYLEEELPKGHAGLRPLDWAGRAMKPGAAFPHHGAVQEACLIASLTSDQAGQAGPVALDPQEDGEDLLYACDLPAAEVLLGEPFGLRGASVRQAAEALALEAGLRPLSVSALPGCGHDFRFLGDEGALGSLARSTARALQRTGAARVLPLCPECGKTLRESYARAGAGLGLPCVDLLDLLHERRDRLRFAKGLMGPRVATYLDDDYGDQERQERCGALLGLAGYEVVARLPEPGGTPALQGSAGVQGFVSCDAASREAQERLIQRAERAGADWLLCASPFSAVHLGCALRRGAWRRHNLGVQTVLEALAHRLVSSDETAA